MCIDKIGEIVEQSDYLGLSVGEVVFHSNCLNFSVYGRILWSICGAFNASSQSEMGIILLSVHCIGGAICKKIIDDSKSMCEVAPN